MIRIITIATLLAVLVSCDRKSENKTAEASPQKKVAAVIDTTPRVVGIGGIFFGSENPKEVRKWYGENLGLAIN